MLQENHWAQADGIAGLAPPATPICFIMVKGGFILMSRLGPMISNNAGPSRALDGIDAP